MTGPFFVPHTSLFTTFAHYATDDTSVVVISRPTYSPDKVGEVIHHNFAGYKYNPSHETWSSPHSKGSFILQHMDPVDISSTDIRNRVRNGKNIRGLIPAAVEEYIKNQKLYIK